MELQINEELVRVIILDISGIYAQIYDQGYFDRNSIDQIKRKYDIAERWHVLVIE